MCVHGGICRYPDAMALSGDDADNVPGVYGIGPRIATKLLSNTADGSLENLFSSLAPDEDKFG